MKCRLKQLLVNIPQPFHDTLIQEIQKASVILRQVQLDAARLANLHFLRCASNDTTAVPDVSQMMYSHCCSASLSRRPHFFYNRNAAQYADLYETCVQYWSASRTEPTYSAVSQTNWSRLLNELARTTFVNAKTMISHHFRSRLRQYIRFRYAPAGKTHLSSRATNRLVSSCYRVISQPGFARPGHHLLVYDDTNDAQELELRAWIGMIPWKHNIVQHSGHFTQKLYQMQTWMENFASHHPRMKGTKLYSLLPLPTSHEPMYITVNSASLYASVAGIQRRDQLSEWSF